jgi:hypothetical protein
MAEHSKMKRSRDLNDQQVVQGLGSRTVTERPKNAAAVALGRLGGVKGGLARATALSPKERSRIAKKAAEARWRRKR